LPPSNDSLSAVPAPPDTFDEQLSWSPLWRRVATADDLQRPTRVYCFRAERRAAERWFRERTGRAPESVQALDGVLQRWATLAPPQPGEQALVFGERLRSKATQLARLGDGRLLYAADPGLAGTRTAPDYWAKHRGALERLWHALADLESRLTLASIVRQRTTGELGYLRVARFAEYCHPLVKAEPGELVVDAGAFNGATSAAFARRVGRSGRVYAFEPSRRNRRLIRQRLLRPWNWTLSVEVVPAALADVVGQGHFDARRGGSSALRSAGAGLELEPTLITTLDAFSADRPRIDLISLDVEGAEPAVLAGAARLIEQQRPKLQVSVYHSLTHLFELPLMLLERYRDYTLYLGHHDVYSTETDAYLVPRERLRA
jgi:FkbM family methyltransferase